MTIARHVRAPAAGECDRPLRTSPPPSSGSHHTWSGSVAKAGSSGARAGASTYRKPTGNLQASAVRSELVSAAAHLEYDLPGCVQVGGEVAAYLVAIRVVGEIDIDVAEQIIFRGQIEVPKRELERLDDQLAEDTGKAAQRHTAYQPHQRHVTEQ